jgi:hypothetical protein
MRIILPLILLIIAAIQGYNLSECSEPGYVIETTVFLFLSLLAVSGIIGWLLNLLLKDSKVFYISFAAALLLDYFFMLNIFR